MSSTSIEWATHTENWLAGCTKVSDACTHCYAETMTARLATMPGAPARYRDGVVEGRRWTGRVSYDLAAMERAFDALRNPRTRPRRVFVNSMSDTFHADAPADSLRDLADEIRALDRDYPGHPHVIMLLTKRPENAVEWQRREFPDGLPRWVWIGCTVEHQLAADERIPHLLRVAAPVRFLSCEPLLGRVDLTAAVGTQWENGGTGDEWRAELWACPRCGGSGYHQTGPYVVGCYECNGNRTGIGWVIVGSESGQRRRPTDLAWVRSLRDQCQGAGVPFFAKQLDVGDGLVHAPVLDGRQHLEFPNG